MKLFEAAKTVDIVEVYKKYTGNDKVRKGKKSTVAPCPFHEDKKPSFNMFPDNGFYCFGCGEHGSSVDMVSKLKNVDASTAAKMICSDFGVQYEDSWRDQPTAARAAGIPESFYRETNKRLLQVFESELKTAPDPQYFAKRGIGALAGEFRFGYCPKAQIFGTKDPKKIEKAKEMGIGNDAGHCVFEGRYIVPILDVMGDPIAFIGRLPDAEVDEMHPKYMISANSCLFKKRMAFFNQKALSAKGTENEDLYVVEGVFDALSMIAAGIRNVVCPFGNSLSDEHVEMLRKSGKNIVLAFDDDKAGEEATIRALGYARGLRLFVLNNTMKPAKDMNEVLVRYKKAGVQSLVDSYLPAPEYMIRSFESNSNLDTLGGQDALWEKFAKMLGSNKAGYEEKYPRNLAYLPCSFEYFWGLFDKTIKAHPLHQAKGGK